MKVLHAAAEIFPLVKTGGLADVLGALPQALIEAGADVRLVLPGLPAIILLDLNMPGTDGRTVLKILKQDPQLFKIPVIIFTTSSNNEDIEECYRLGANSYVTKPINYSALEEKVCLIVRYWLEFNELPSPN